MPSALNHQSPRILKRWIVCVLMCLCTPICSIAQRNDPQGPVQVTTGVNMGPDPLAQIDLKLLYLDQVNRDAKKSAERRKQDQNLVDSGVVSALDLQAPNKAVDEFNRATTLMKAQNSKEAIAHLQKAIHVYPNFVSAHIGLGLAYLDQEDPALAKSEFETAAHLDQKFPGSFLNLGVVALTMNDYATAEPELERAAFHPPQRSPYPLPLWRMRRTAPISTIRPSKQHREVHALEHKGMANVHYVAASAAMSLGDFETMERELGFFLAEDPTNAFAPVARQNLAALTHNRMVRAEASANPPQTTLVASLRPQTFPNSERLKAQLNAVGNESDAAACEDCGAVTEPTPGDGGG